MSFYIYHSSATACMRLQFLCNSLLETLALVFGVSVGDFQCYLDKQSLVVEPFGDLAYRYRQVVLRYFSFQFELFLFQPAGLGFWKSKILLNERSTRLSYQE